MSYLFISDLHLHPQYTDITQIFLRFLKEDAPQATALYILGDLFDSWIGDDETSPFHQEIIHALKQLRTSGTKIYFAHGNRDFLIGKQFATACGIELLSEETVIHPYGMPILLMHGDTLCTFDVSYQRFRKIVHQRWIQKLFLSLPLRWRLNIAKRMRDSSQQQTQSKSMDMMDVDPKAVVEVMTKHKVQQLIHGHTHRPACHDIQLSEHQQGQRHVLGDWHQQQGYVLQLDDNNEFTVRHLTL